MSRYRGNVSLQTLMTPCLRDHEFCPNSRGLEEHREETRPVLTLAWVRGFCRLCRGGGLWPLSSMPIPGASPGPEVFRRPHLSFSFFLLLLLIHCPSAASPSPSADLLWNPCGHLLTLVICIFLWKLREQVTFPRDTSLFIPIGECERRFQLI